MTDKEIWNARANDESISDIARRANLTEKEIRDILKRAPQMYQHRYIRSSVISDGVFAALPPKKKH